MLPNAEGFEDEFAFYEAASLNDNQYRSYRAWMIGPVGEEVDRLIAAKLATVADRSALIEAAMAPYDKAFVAYGRRDIGVPVSYPFSKYYRWWARQHAMQWVHS